MCRFCTAAACSTSLLMLDCSRLGTAQLERGEHEQFLVTRRSANENIEGQNTGQILKCTRTKAATCIGLAVCRHRLPLPTRGILIQEHIALQTDKGMQPDERHLGSLADSKLQVKATCLVSDMRREAWIMSLKAGWVIA